MHLRLKGYSFQNFKITKENEKAYCKAKEYAQLIKNGERKSLIITGNIGTGKSSVELTNSIPDGSSTGAINFGNVTWSDEQASVTISTDYTQYKIEYQKNGTIFPY